MISVRQEFTQEMQLVSNKLAEVIKAKKTHLCIGIDPPEKYYTGKIIDLVKNTKDYCVAYKLNLAHFISRTCFYDLYQVLTEIHTICPENMIILDGKFGDIGSTNDYYAKLSQRNNIDGLTLNPYSGIENLEPFFNQKGSLHFVLTRMSQPSFMQTKEVCTEIVNQTKGRCGYVLTTREEDYFDLVTELSEDSFLLLVGIGAQGGKISLMNKLKHNNFIFNVSRPFFEDQNVVNTAKFYARIK